MGFFEFTFDPLYIYSYNKYSESTKCMPDLFTQSRYNDTSIGTISYSIWVKFGCFKNNDVIFAED